MQWHPSTCTAVQEVMKPIICRKQGGAESTAKMTTYSCSNALDQVGFIERFVRHPIALHPCKIFETSSIANENGDAVP